MRAGGAVGSPKWARMARTVTGSVTKATIRSRCHSWHTGGEILRRCGPAAAPKRTGRRGGGPVRQRFGRFRGRGRSGRRMHRQDGDRSTQVRIGRQHAAVAMVVDAVADPSGDPAEIFYFALLSLSTFP